VRAGFRITSLGQTVSQLCYDLTCDDLVCLLDSALHLGWDPTLHPLNRAKMAYLSAALALADGRSESALETLLRLLLVRAGVGPETLQLKLYDDRGRRIARLDMAWPSRMLAVEADGREFHDKVEALYRDRDRQNDVVIDDWRVLRFTWYDLIHRPARVLEKVRAALARPLRRI
jgi:hypothetical protein